MDFLQLISFLCELIKIGAETVVSQLHWIEKKLRSLIESKVSNNNEIYIRLNSLEKLVSNGNDTQLRQEIKMQELHDLVSKCFGKLNHQELEQKEESLIKEKTQEVMSTDSKELQDLVSKSVEKTNLQLNEANNDEELEQKEKSLTEEMTKEMSMDEKIMPNDGVEMLNRMESISELVDKYLFGSKKEQMVFESLCHKWSIENFEGKELRTFYFRDDLFIEEYNFQAQLRLKRLPNGMVNFGFCFKDKDEERKKMESKVPPIVTMILKDCSGRTDKKHVVYSEHYFVTNANPFYSSDNWLQIKNDNLNELISPNDKSLEVLFLVNPPTVFSKLISTDGTLTDIIQYFEEKFQTEHVLSHGHWSPPFLTHPNGYRVFVKICLERNSDESHNELVASIYFFPDGDLPHDIDVTFSIIHPTKKSKKNILTQKRLNPAGENKINIGKIHQIENGGLISLNAVDYSVKIQIVK